MSEHHDPRTCLTCNPAFAPPPLPVHDYDPQDATMTLHHYAPGLDFNLNYLRHEGHFDDCKEPACAAWHATFGSREGADFASHDPSPWPTLQPYGDPSASEIEWLKALRRRVRRRLLGLVVCAALGAVAVARVRGADVVVRVVTVAKVREAGVGWGRQQ